MVWFALIAALAFAMFHGFVGLPHLASAAPAGPVPAAETSMAQGWSAWQRGAFEEAVRSWQDAAQRYAQAGQPRAQSMALTQLARAYQVLGQYRQAGQSPSSVLELAQKAGNQVQIATVLGSLGGPTL
jgi:tetratricopeptide (TPR) repeat protein